MHVSHKYDSFQRCYKDVYFESGMQGSMDRREGPYFDIRVNEPQNGSLFLNRDAGIHGPQHRSVFYEIQKIMVLLLWSINHGLCHAER